MFTNVEALHCKVCKPHKGAAMRLYAVFLKKTLSLCFLCFLCLKTNKYICDGFDPNQR